MVDFLFLYGVYRDGIIGDGSCGGRRMIQFRGGERFYIEMLREDKCDASLLILLSLRSSYVDGQNELISAMGLECSFDFYIIDPTFIPRS